ncbi:right-handed parallel beta-helix repeat-containing protein [bacterium]|nr:right-handed parallel beta-helix repeat-containing protein [bacterium]
MKRKWIVGVLCLLIFQIGVLAQYSERIFNNIVEYDKDDAEQYLDVGLFGYPADGTVFFHPLSGGYFYKGILVSDQNWHRIVIGRMKYDPNGNFISGSQKLWSKGTLGSGNVQFQNPKGVAVTYYNANHVDAYIADSGNNRIVKLRLNLDTGNVDAQYYYDADSHGGFNHPVDVAVFHNNNQNPSDDEIYVADSWNNRIIAMYGSSGNVIFSHGTYGTGQNQLIEPVSVIMCRNNDVLYKDYIWVSDLGNHRIVNYFNAGTGMVQENVYEFPVNSEITDLGFDQTGHCFYAIERQNHKVHKFVGWTVFNLYKCGEYGERGFGSDQLFFPQSVDLANPIPAPGGFFGPMEGGIIEQWTDHSGIKNFNIEGVDVTNLEACVNQYGAYMTYAYRMPSGVGFRTERIRYPSGTLIKTLVNDVFTEGDVITGSWDRRDQSGNLLPYGDYKLEVYFHSTWVSGSGTPADEITRTTQFKMMNIGSTISNNLTLSGIIEINSDITVNNNATLTILPGTTMKFNGYYMMTVENGAKMIAIGNSENPIVFTSSTGSLQNKWKYVRLRGGNNTIKWAIFEYGLYPLYLYICTSGSSNVIENCTFRNNSNYGLRIYKSYAKVKNCEMFNNGYYGLHLYNNPDVKLAGNYIHHNSNHGIYTLTGNFLEFYGNFIEKNGVQGSTSYHGIMTSGGDHLHIGEPYSWAGKNTIRNNYGYEIYASSGDPHVEICDGSIHDDTSIELYNYSTNQSIYALSGYWDINGCQYSGPVSLVSSHNYLPSWDGSTLDDYQLNKTMQSNWAVLVDSLGNKYDQIKQYKQIISDDPYSQDALRALSQLYHLLREDYNKNEFAETKSFKDDLKIIRKTCKNSALRKKALYYLCIWENLDNERDSAIKHGKQALMELDDEERKYIAANLVALLTESGNIKDAVDYLDMFNTKYGDEDEICRILTDDIEDITEQLQKGLFDPIAEHPDMESEMSPPRDYVLYQNKPNPANPSTIIHYQIANQGHVELYIFNILGERVKVIANQNQIPGYYTQSWDGTNQNGIPVSTGLYFCQLKAGGKVMTKKIMLIR